MYFLLMTIYRLNGSQVYISRLDFSSKLQTLYSVTYQASPSDGDESQLKFNISKYCLQISSSQTYSKVRTFRPYICSSFSLS